MTQLVSSFERFEGNDLRAEEVSALAFWQLIDQEKKGWIGLQDSKEIFGAFKFDTTVFDADWIRNEFYTAGADKEMERDSEIVRFELIRQVFLERGL